MNIEIFKPTMVMLGIIACCVAFFAIPNDQVPPKPDRGEKNAQVLREFIEKHCRVVVQTGATMSLGEMNQTADIQGQGKLTVPAERTFGQIKCDQ